MSQPTEDTKDRKKTLALGGLTLVCALGIGYVMQYGLALPGQTAAIASDAPVTLTDISPTSSAGAIDPPMSDGGDLMAPALASAAQLSAFQPRMAEDTEVTTLAAIDTDLLQGLTDGDIAAPEAANGFACDIDMSAQPTAGALVTVAITAPCHAAERVTLHHQGMMFTEVMSPKGALTVTVPALAERALFIASFASGDGATAMADVPNLAFYDRVVVQWKGEAGLGLHAREYGADYFSPGHIYAAASGDISATARGEAGFLTALGNIATPEPQRAEIYSFPKGAAKTDGNIALTVEAEITQANCDTTVEAQTLEIREGSSLRTRNLTLDMPGCSTTGDFLVLKNLVEDLTIAAR